MNTANIPTQTPDNNIPALQDNARPKPDTRKKDIPIEDIIEYAERGLNLSEIGRLVGCSHTNVSDRLERIGYKKTRVEHYKKNRADLKAFAQSLVDGHVINFLASDAAKIENWKDFDLAQRGKTHDFNNERLERGQSTENISTIYQVIQDIKAGKVGGDSDNQASEGPEIVDITPLDIDNQDTGDEGEKV